MPNNLRRRLRVNSVGGTLGGNYTNGSGTIDLGAALPTAAVPDGSRSYLPIVVTPTTGTRNIIWITGPATSGNNYPCVGGKEGSTDGGALSGDAWEHGPTVQDFGGVRRIIGPFNVTHATPSITTGVELFTPNVGDVILNVFMVVHAAWDVDGGCDFGTFLNAGDSYATAFGSLGVGVWRAAETGTDLSLNISENSGAIDLASDLAYEYDGGRAATVVLNAVPFCVKIAGAATVGAVDVYVEVATPTTSY